MKLTKRIAAIAVVAAIASSAITAFAAPASKYDALMAEAQDLYNQGLYYEANFLVEQAATEIPVWTSEMYVLSAAIDAQLNALETINVSESLSLQFGRISDLMMQGLYYEAKSLLEQTADAYATEINASYVLINKVDTLDVAINQAIADYEMDYISNLLNDGLYYEANLEYSTIPSAALTTQQWERYTALGVDIAYALDHVIMDAESAVAVLVNDTNFVSLVDADPDYVLETEALYHGQELVGFGILVKSNSTGAYLGGYMVNTDGSVIQLGDGVLDTYDQVMLYKYDPYTFRTIGSPN